MLNLFVKSKLTSGKDFNNLRKGVFLSGGPGIFTSGGGYNCLFGCPILFFPDVLHFVIHVVFRD